MIAYDLGLLTIRSIDVVDVLFVSILFYQLYKLVKGSVTVKIIAGFILLYSIYWIADKSDMHLLHSILHKFIKISPIAIVVIFQYEFRKFFSSLGGIFFLNKKQLLKHFPSWSKKKGPVFNTTAIVETSKILGGSNTGGLIVLSNTDDLKFYIESGDLLNAAISKRLLLAILNKESPLHDGAVIIYQDKIVAARCILPITERKVPAQFGLRHRAAIGMSEVTDTLVIVVSEETGQLSIARKGSLDHNVSTQELRTIINEYIK